MRMKLKYAANHARKRKAGAVLVGMFLSFALAATLVLNLLDIEAALRDGTWKITAVLLAGVLVCGYLYVTPTSYLRLNPETRVATLPSGQQINVMRMSGLIDDREWLKWMGAISVLECQRLGELGLGLDSRSWNIEFCR